MKVPVSARAALLRELLEGPGHGLALILRISDATEEAVILGEGSVYPELVAMRDEGLITLEEHREDPRRGGRAARVATLTEKGTALAKEQKTTVLALYLRRPSR